MEQKMVLKNQQQTSSEQNIFSSQQNRRDKEIKGKTDEVEYKDNQVVNREYNHNEVVNKYNQEIRDKVKQKIEWRL